MTDKPESLFQKVWDAHRVRELPTGQTQLLIGTHLIHEVTSPQAFAMIRELGLPVRFPNRTFATVDHIIPTDDQSRPLQDDLAETMMSELERNCRDHSIQLFSPETGAQGIVHVIGPELGLTQPGMTIACGDSHTSTHGAFGAIAFGIGTSQVRDLLASQSMAISPLKVRRIEVTGELRPGVYAKDVVLAILRELGVNGGVGYAYEYAGPVVDAMSIEERMTVCNMSIEGGARCGYVNPDEKTVEYLRGRRYTPNDEAFDARAQAWLAMASDPNCHYDDRVEIDGSAIEPSITWGIHPGHNLGVSEAIPTPNSVPNDERAGVEEALEYMDFTAGASIAGTPIDVAFIGSCTNGRISDLREAARVAQTGRVKEGVRALVVPGSMAVKQQAEAEGLHEIFRAAGFQWREPGCSMCLAMNPDKLRGREVCASSSNRNFKGRQGSPSGRTLLMSPAMVAAAAIAGKVVDVQKCI
ncbi:MAG: 3-isopropylmalate dehydratase large subunit [bacterium]|nr:3-isopropylmalate dehydratase large subunit [Deltaproteobacteria bacterium]MCP4907547.1 3-isopropylmalate dehydratase large subunit [bacterium]